MYPTVSGTLSVVAPAAAAIDNQHVQFLSGAMGAVSQGLIMLTGAIVLSWGAFRIIDGAKGSHPWTLSEEQSRPFIQQALERLQFHAALAAVELGLPEYAMFAWDARGHGRSPGPRGDSPSFAPA